MRLIPKLGSQRCQARSSHPSNTHSEKTRTIATAILTWTRRRCKRIGAYHRALISITIGLHYRTVTPKSIPLNSFILSLNRMEERILPWDLAPRAATYKATTMCPSSNPRPHSKKVMALTSSKIVVIVGLEMASSCRRKEAAVELLKTNQMLVIISYATAGKNKVYIIQQRSRRAKEAQYLKGQWSKLPAHTCLITWMYYQSRRNWDLRRTRSKLWEKCCTHQHLRTKRRRWLSYLRPLHNRWARSKPLIPFRG